MYNSIIIYCNTQLSLTFIIVYFYIIFWSVSDEDHIIEDYEIGEPGLHRVGEGSMGGASIPPDTIVKVYYTNNSNVDKTLIGALEFYK